MQTVFSFATRKCHYAHASALLGAIQSEFKIVVSNLTEVVQILYISVAATDKVKIAIIIASVKIFYNIIVIL